jgi:hypothetical protein
VQTARWRDVFLQRWTSSGASADLQAMMVELREYLRALQGNKGMVVALLEIRSLQTPDAEIRKLIKECTDLLTPNVYGAAVVITSTGFAASILRSVMSGLMLLRRGDYPTKTVATVREAAELLAPLRRDGVSTEGFERMVRGFVTSLPVAS